MFAEDIAQGFMQQVGGGVVALNSKTAAFVHLGFVGLVKMFGQFGYDVDD